MILSAISSYANAWSQKDLDTIVGLYPSLDKRKIKSQLADSKTIQMSIRPISEPAIIRGNGTVSCSRTVQQSFRNGPEMTPAPTAVTVRLSRHGANWIIDAIQQ